MARKKPTPTETRESLAVNSDFFLAFQYKWVEPHGNRRTREEHPYSFDGHYILYDDEAVKRCTKLGTFYTDRLREMCGLERWDEIFNAMRIKHRSFDKFSPADCRKFIRLMFGEKYTFCALSAWCRQSDGIPYWGFHLGE